MVSPMIISLTSKMMAISVAAQTKSSALMTKTILLALLAYGIKSTVSERIFNHHSLFGLEYGSMVSTRPQNCWIKSKV